VNILEFTPWKEATDGTEDFGPVSAFDVSLDGGSSWARYTGAFNATLTGNGLTSRLLVRTAIVNDLTPDNGETFTLTATPTGGTAVVGTATIKDDGTGTLFKADGSLDTTSPKNNDVTVTSPTVNEGSSYAVFTVRATQGQELSLALAAGTLLAHHSFSAEYDQNKPVTLKGSVTKLEWTNPHARIYVDAKDDKGAVINWNIELGGPLQLNRLGWKRDSVKVGDIVKVDGYLAKDGSKMANARNVMFADGRKVFAGTSGDGAPPQ